jgi:diacylglycerol kinase family enzyme
VETDAMSVRQRWLARRRLPNGTHVPHPQVRERRVPVVELQFDRAVRVWLDGAAAGRATTITVHVVPDAFLVAV